MGLVLFSWLAAQSYFKETSNTDIRRRLIEERESMFEEDLSPVGIFDDGREEKIIEDGQVWSNVR